MVLLPNLKDYDIKALVALGNQASDNFVHNKFKMVIIEKLFSYNYSMLFLVNKFMISQKILKEAYADVIIMNMKDYDYYIDDTLSLEIIRYASLDVLMYYGADAVSLDFAIKCKDEFWRRANEIEDKVELQKKKMLGSKMLKQIYNKRKGDIYD